MSDTPCYRLPGVSVVDLVGDDSVKIAQNLTTNDLAAMPAGSGRETFVTDVRGKTLGHFVVFRTDRGLRFLGPAGQSQRLAEHADRYTIREDAEPQVADENWVGWVVPTEAASRLPIEWSGDHRSLDSGDLRSGQLVGQAVLVYEVPWLGEGTLLLLAAAEAADSLAEHLAEHSCEPAEEEAFHHARVRSGFPWYGIDLDETNLPQEADRNAQAICFTKGCYLGQETVARLDALGQVQKKLVRWSLSGGVPAVGSKLERDGKVVGRLTSVAPGTDFKAVAIGYARRTHFDAGAEAEGTDAVSGQPFRGRVG